MSNTMHQLNYSNDLFFKYIPSREDEGSVYVRNTIIKRVIEVRVKESAVLNLNLDPGIIGEKHVILDVHVKDEQNRHFNIEMQTTRRGITEIMRFEFYGARALNNQLKSGESYDQLKPIYQATSTDEYAWNDRNLVGHCQTCSEQGEDGDDYPLILRTFVHMSVVNGIVEEREMQRLSDFEQLVYLLGDDGKNDILRPKERLVRVFMNKYEEIQKDGELQLITVAIQMGETRYHSGLRDNFKEGKIAGKTGGRIEGELEGEKQFSHKLTEARYHKDYVMWLQALTEGQMYVASVLLLGCGTFESSKKQLHNADMG